jgi:hypothetical protein
MFSVSWAGQGILSKEGCMFDRFAAAAFPLGRLTIFALFWILLRLSGKRDPNHSSVPRLPGAKNNGPPRTYAKNLSPTLLSPLLSQPRPVIPSQSYPSGRRVRFLFCWFSVQDALDALCIFEMAVVLAGSGA